MSVRHAVAFAVASVVGGVAADALAANPTDLATAQEAPGAIAMDAARVYWVAGDAIMSAPIAGGPPATIVSNAGHPSAVAVDGANVYWVDTGGAVMRVSKGGGSPVTLVPSNAPVGASMGMAVDDADIFWTRGVTKGGSNLSLGSVLKVAKTGGTPVTIAKNQETPWGIALTKDAVLWTNYAMWAPGTAGAVKKAPKTGGSVVTIASADHPTSIATDGTNVFWTDWGKGTVMKAPLDGGAATALVTGETKPLGIAVDGTHAYWTNCYAMNGPAPCAGTIRKVPKAGGAPVQLASGQVNPFGIVVDGAHVFWTARGDSARVHRAGAADGAVREQTK